MLSGISYAACGSWSGNTVTAGGVTAAEINACVAEISTSNVGEVTINLPSGTASDTGTVSVNMNDARYANVTKLSIIGNGTIPTGSTKGSAGNTIIDRGTTENSWLDFTGNTSKKFRMSNITLLGGGNWDDTSHGTQIMIKGSSRVTSGGGFRFDHITNGSTEKPCINRFFYISGRTYGVFDHNISISQYNNLVRENQSDGGNSSWNTNISVGTADAVYLEDNTFTNTSTGKNWFLMDGDCGSRHVVRYNTITNHHIGWHDSCSDHMRSGFQYEAYNNTISNSFSNTPFVWARGGTYIVYNNTLTRTGYESWAGDIFFDNYRSRSNAAAYEPWSVYSSGAFGACDYESVPAANCSTAGTCACLSGTVSPRWCTSDADCGGTAGSCQRIDDITSINGTNRRYPCRDQIGMSYTTVGGYTHYPSLFWNNTRTSGTLLVGNSGYDVTYHIVEGRDYCLSSNTGTNINGVTGGYRPSDLASCGGHATTYIPYIYPHPLVSGATDTSSPNISSPAACSGVDCTTPLACTGESANVSISLACTDNVACTGCRASTSTTTYADMATTLTNTSGTTWGTTVTSACSSSVNYNARCTDAAGNISNLVNIVYDMADNEDTTAPTMSTQAIGADGRTVTFTFSEPVRVGTGGSAGFTLTNGGSEEIAITYVSGSGSATLTYHASACVPSTDTFTSGLVYTQPGNGIEDMAGNDLASFSGAGAKTVTNGSTQACDLATSLFEHGESAPSGSANASGNALNLGVKFQTSTQGTMTHCWFYKIAADTGTHVCTVYRVFDGSVVGTVNFADESESGWQDQAFASALNIAADEDYIVTVSHPTGNWTSTVDYFLSTYTNSNLTATTSGTDYAGRYVYGASMAYPTNDSARNYWVDFTMSYATAGGPWQCTVSRTGDGCMVTGSQVVTNGNTCSATVTLRNGWKATWGGTCAAGSETGGVYTSGAVTADCTVVATCVEQGILP